MAERLILRPLVAEDVPVVQRLSRSRKVAHTYLLSLWNLASGRVLAKLGPVSVTIDTCPAPAPLARRRGMDNRQAVTLKQGRAPAADIGGGTIDLAATRGGGRAGGAAAVPEPEGPHTIH